MRLVRPSSGRCFSRWPDVRDPSRGASLSRTVISLPEVLLRTATIPRLQRAWRSDGSSQDGRGRSTRLAGNFAGTVKGLLGFATGGGRCRAVIGTQAALADGRAAVPR